VFLSGPVTTFIFLNMISDQGFCFLSFKLKYVDWTTLYLTIGMVDLKKLSYK